MVPSVCPRTRSLPTRTTATEATLCRLGQIDGWRWCSEDEVTSYQDTRWRTADGYWMEGRRRQRANWYWHGVISPECGLTTSCRRWSTPQSTHSGADLPKHTRPPGTPRWKSHSVTLTTDHELNRRLSHVIVRLLATVWMRLSPNCTYAWRERVSQLDCLSHILSQDRPDNMRHMTPSLH